MDLSGFDATKIAPSSAFEPLPAGDYTAIIVASEIKQTKAGDGSYLQLKIQVVDGPHKNRTLFDRLNLWNKNEQAVQIAKSTLSAICHAVGIMQPKDSSELHNRPMRIVVKCRKYNDDIENKVKGYSPVGKKPNAKATDAIVMEAEPPLNDDDKQAILDELNENAPWK